MSTDFLGIPGYWPTWQRGATEINRRWGELIARLVGRRLGGIWLLYGSDGECLCDAPVLLGFGHTVVEVCHNKFDELSITNNTIDRARSAEGDWNDESWEWRQSDLAETSELVGRIITSAGFVEWRGESDDIANGMVALRLDLGSETLLVYNGLDENAIAVGSPDDRYRQVPAPT